MLTRVLLPRRSAVSVGRLFSTSVPRWNIPTSDPSSIGDQQSLDSIEVTATAPLDAIKAQPLKTKDVQKADLDDRDWNEARWKVPTSLEGAMNVPFDAAAIKAQLAQLKTAQQAIQKAELEARKDRIAASVAARNAKRGAMLEARRARMELLIVKVRAQPLVDLSNIGAQQLPDSMEGTATASLDAAAIKAQLAQLKTAQQAIQKAELEARKDRIAASIAARNAKRVVMLEARRARMGWGIGYHPC